MVFNIHLVSHLFVMYLCNLILFCGIATIEIPHVIVCDYQVLWTEHKFINVNDY